MTETIENSQYDKERSMSSLVNNDGYDDLYELLGFRDDLPIEDELSQSILDDGRALYTGRLPETPNMLDSKRSRKQFNTTSQ